MELQGITTQQIIGRQVTSLLDQTGIRVEGLAFAIKMSINHLRTVKAGKASISTRTAGKIADFFEIKVNMLISEKSIKLRKPDKIETIKQFYEENKNNPKFFIDRQRENSVAHFLRTGLIPGGYLNDEREVSEMRVYCLTKYQRKFESKELSRQLGRLVDEGLLSRRDKFGNGTVYLYRKKVG
jgi:plasmid maintenance system antidote protein VapI